MSARRVALSVDEFAVVCEDHRISLPAGYLPMLSGAAGDVAAAADVARAHLGERGITGPALAALADNLRLFATARILITTDIVVDDEQLHCLVGFDDTVGATLAHAGDRGVELSVWPAPELPHELRRIVPAMPEWPHAPTVVLDVDTLIAALALEQLGRHDGARMLIEDGVGAADAAEFLALSAGARGSLHTTILTTADDGPAAVTHVAWILTQAGWSGLRRRGYGVIETVPVAPGELGAFVAPYLATLIA